MVSWLLNVELMKCFMSWFSLLITGFSQCLGNTTVSEKNGVPLCVYEDNVRWIVLTKTSYLLLGEALATRFVRTLLFLMIVQFTLAISGILIFSILNDQLYIVFGSVCLRKEPSGDINSIELGTLTLWLLMTLGIQTPFGVCNFWLCFCLHTLKEIASVYCHFVCHLLCSHKVLLSRGLMW